MKKTLSIALVAVAPLVFSQTANAEFDFLEADSSFKRFSISGGWLHAEPQGNGTPLVNKTAIKDGSKHAVVGSEVEFQGLDTWSSPGTGLESDTVDTLGLLFNYHVNDNWSVEVKAGIPPKVDILGNGEVYANLTKPIPDEIHITDLSQGSGVSSTARAWLPAAEIHYQLGEPGVDKFRPYIGAGVMYAYFDDIELSQGAVNDLAVAGGRIQLIKDGNGIEATSNSSKEVIAKNPKAKVERMQVEADAESVFAPIVTVGATYDFNDDWFVAGSVSYAKLDSDTTITVKNDKGEQLIEAKANIDIDPYITYLGLGYRF